MTNPINLKCSCGNREADVQCKKLIETQKLVLDKDMKVITPRKTKQVIIAKCLKCGKQHELQDDDERCRKYFP